MMLVVIFIRMAMNNQIVYIIPVRMGKLLLDRLRMFSSYLVTLVLFLEFLFPPKFQLVFKLPKRCLNGKNAGNIKNTKFYQRCDISTFRIFKTIRHLAQLKLFIFIEIHENASN